MSDESKVMNTLLICGAVIFVSLFCAMSLHFCVGEICDMERDKAAIRAGLVQGRLPNYSGVYWVKPEAAKPNAD